MKPHAATPMTSAKVYWRRLWSVLELLGRGARTPPLIGKRVDELRW